MLNIILRDIYVLDGPDLRHLALVYLIYPCVTQLGNRHINLYKYMYVLIVANYLQVETSVYG